MHTIKSSSKYPPDNHMGSVQLIKLYAVFLSIIKYFLNIFSNRNFKCIRGANAINLEVL